MKLTRNVINWQAVDESPITILVSSDDSSLVSSEPLVQDSEPPAPDSPQTTYWESGYSWQAPTTPLSLTPPKVLVITGAFLYGARPTVQSLINVLGSVEQGSLSRYQHQRAALIVARTRGLLKIRYANQRGIPIYSEEQFYQAASERIALLLEEEALSENRRSHLTSARYALAVAMRGRPLGVQRMATEYVIPALHMERQWA